MCGLEVRRGALSPLFHSGIVLWGLTSWIRGCRKSLRRSKLGGKLDAIRIGLLGYQLHLLLILRRNKALILWSSAVGDAKTNLVYYESAYRQHKSQIIICPSSTSSCSPTKLQSLSKNDTAIMSSDRALSDDQVCQAILGLSGLPPRLR